MKNLKQYLYKNFKTLSSFLMIGLCLSLTFLIRKNILLISAFLAGIIDIYTLFSTFMGPGGININNPVDPPTPNVNTQMLSRLNPNLVNETRIVIPLALHNFTPITQGNVLQRIFGYQLNHIFVNPRIKTPGFENILDSVLSRPQIGRMDSSLVFRVLIGHRYRDYYNNPDNVMYERIRRMSKENLVLPSGNTVPKFTFKNNAICLWTDHYSVTSDQKIVER